ncbi:unnamed protein product [Schistosoma curassoni]|uniref:Telomerase reverse transcriptase n=1 Tax=Schistosoma curassoni TaxID=6186 RepID=A0A183JD96_9TREM|nr:unnamed protein product [Schistosoma curassoni]
MVGWIKKTSTSQRWYGIQWTAWTQLFDLDFADDLALLSHTHEQLQMKTTNVAAASMMVGVNIQKGTTKILKYNTENTNSITLDGKTLEHAGSFTYLDSSIIDEQGGSDADVKVPDDRSSIWRPYFYSLVYTLLSGLVVFYLKKYFRWCEFNTVVPTVAYFTHESWKKLSTDFITDLIKNNIIQNKINNNSMSLIYSNETINKTYILTYSIGRLSMKPFGKGFRLVINANYHLLSLKNLINQTGLNSNIQYSIQPCLSLNQRLKLNNGLFEFLRKLKIELPGIYAPSLLSTKSAFKTLLSFRSLVYSIGFRRFWIAKLDILDFFNQIIHSKLVEVFSDTLNEIDGKLYSFIKGIPQGSCISSDLANIYLAHLDRQLHRTQTILWSPHKFLQNDVFKTTDIHLNKCSTILRYLDDYLCISTSKIELQNLIKRINTCEEYLLL